MELIFFCCNDCGYEVVDEYVAYSRTCATGNIYICPQCGNESDNVEEPEN